MVTRCVDCQELRDDPEKPERLRRIEQALPPTLSFEGQLQRRVRERPQDDEFETVWSGGAGLTSVGREDR